MAKKPKNDSLLSVLGRAALRRGTVGGQRGYLALPIGLAVLRAVRRAGSKDEENVTIEKMKPGETMTLTTLKPPSRRERKAARR